MKTIWTHNHFNLGDNLLFLHLLRSIAKSHPDHWFIHFCNGCHLEPLRDMVTDLPNVMLDSFDARSLWDNIKDVSIDTWKNAGAGEGKPGFWERSQFRWDFSNFYLEHHAWTARRMGFKSPFFIKEHLLFDYPRLEAKGTECMYDFLIINSEPCSGQFGPMKQHGSGYLDELILDLAKEKQVITTSKVGNLPCTREKGMNITDIGALSCLCENHLMVASGPMWPTINTHNNHDRSGRMRIALLDNGEQLNLPEIHQCATVDEARQLLCREGLL
jgi:hypothetical protein